ncbi:CBASS cGAMP-activated phospholipase [Halovulum marinum]|uniref:CBASS cGAMP-activated phospholipase n=1 Tax=Halovulum marinum TaxID=2662447 RepID=UPI002D787A29|nr:CBASS cGAMP-activated phospholipase [Halovulum marinum]
MPEILLPAPNPGAATILALHGGGYLGYFSACVAAALQMRRETLRAAGPLSRSFDAICGTSVGAILAAGIATNTSPRDILDLMSAKGGAIFPRRRYFANWPGIFTSRFDPHPLHGLLTDILGPVRLGEVDRVLVIPAVNETLGRPVIFRSSDPEHWDIPLVDVVMASAAAPLYFPLHRIGGERYTDGGLVANGPALIASADLFRRFGIGTRRQRVVSIGTTRTAPRSIVTKGKHDRWGGVRWIWGGGRLQQLVMGGQEDLQSELLAVLGPAGRLHLDMELSTADAEKVHMVKADAEAREVLGAAAASCVAEISPDERGFLDRILTRRSRDMAWRRGPGGRPVAVLV